jgi:XRE family transcriptional regulator, aerobic/anaerobic benzoate catabolism transcriptional regulator
MNQMLKELGARVRAARTASALTVQALGAESGLSPRFIAQIEAGEGNISMTRLAQLASALGLSPHDLIASDGGNHSLRSEVWQRIEQFNEEEMLELKRWLDTRAGSRRPRLIALVGLRGAGKSTIGALLARRMNMPFIELDSLIEQAAGMSLGEVFSLHGEDYYRRLEREQLARVLRETSTAVIAVGGSIVSDEQNWALLKRRCLTIWLRATPRDHMQRVIRQGDTRPMRDNPAAMTELRGLLERREPLYAESDLEIRTSGRKIQTVVEQILNKLKKPAT